MKLNSKRAAIAAVAVAAALVVGCGSDDSTTSDSGNPEDAVQAFYDASKAKDAEAACATLTTDSQDFAAGNEDSCEASFDKSVNSGQSSIPDSIEIGDVTTDGDTATVPVTADGQNTEFTVVQEDGEWKIDLTGTASAPSDSSGATDSTTG
jgi:hypothetical protein